MALNKKSDGELLELALLEIEKLKEEILLLRGQLNEIPYTVPFMDLEECYHEYPNPWHSITPPHCIKCGKQAPEHIITYSNGTGNLPWNFEEHGGNVMNSDNPVVTHDSSKEIKTNYITDTSRLF